MSDILLVALRQYMHNDGSGFVAGYDEVETKIVVEKLLKEAEVAKKIVENLELRHRSAVRVKESLKRSFGESDELSPLDLALAREDEAWNALEASKRILNGEKP